jgi:uncharacterized protein (TIGR03000 family)
MRCILAAGAVLLVSGAIAHAAPPAFRPPNPPPPSATPRPAPGIPALSIYPSLRAYEASAFFYGDFSRRYVEQYPPPMLYYVPEAPPVPLPPEADPARAKILLQVPETAEVFVDGEKLKQNGANREFYSQPLPEGQRVAYQLLVRWSDGKKPLERKLSVTAGPGEKPTLMVLNPLTK